MTSPALALADSATMLRRNLKHALRYPAVTVILAALPVVILLLFVFVLGGTLGAGLAGGSAGRREYVAYVTPGILMLGVASGAQGVAISIAMDRTEGIMARFRSMAIFRPSILAGHALGSLIQTMAGAALVLGVAVLVGFRPDATPVEWLAGVGLLAFAALALTWLCLAMGLASSTVEAASNLPMPIILLPFFGSGFVPAENMPAALRLFATYQPFTPVIETLRGLLTGTGIGGRATLALAWCAVLCAGGVVWSVWLFNRRPAAV